MGKKIVVDTNNLISALGWEGNSRKLFRRIINEEIEWFISLKQIKELKRVMDYPRFKFTEEQKRKFLEIIFEIANVIDTKTKLDIVKEDSDDNIILECAVECKVNFIITGDKHLLKLKEFKGIKIIRVKDFLKEAE